MVEEPTTAMYILSLKSNARNWQAVSKIEEKMVLVRNLGVTADDVAEILRAKIFPIKLPEGESRFAAASTKTGPPKYVILDNTPHKNVFWGKVAYLDFSIEELRDTRGFLTACDLESQRTSSLVEKVTNVGGTQDKDMARIIQSKALALVR